MAASSLPPQAGVIVRLEDAAARVARLEKDARAALYEAKDEDAYRRLMREKALLLAGLPENLASCLANLPPAARLLIEAALGRFAQGAQAALSLDSVFYMSALLYPDCPAPGEPNNLEILIRDLKKRAL